MVKAWRETLTIPTYQIGEPEKNPIFLEKRVYQGSSGVVYPYPVIEKIFDEKKDVDYQAVWLENEYIKVMILPELGGRVQMAYDKIKQRHFIYYNHVVKPALVGLTGPWISGGIEFNWPQHHRPSTFLPIDSTIEENADGSVTVWVNEQERMFHQKGMAGFTLRPGCAFLEIKGSVYNRTDLPQTFLWWANSAVKVNDDYQSVFPPDINAVFDHGKRAVSSFPIATGTYYKMDYSAGVDISNYKNIKVPTSYMAVNSKYNFEGGYENDTQGGMLHVASYHFSPGKKQWTWGNGDFGRAWDRNLTDTDGPYIELMAGVYTENQPDFAWLMPYEEKHFTQYFMPYRELGLVKNATKDLVMNIERVGQSACLKLLATHRLEVLIVLQNAGGEIFFNQKAVLTPEAVMEETIDIASTEWTDLRLSIMATGLPYAKTLMQWQPETDDLRPLPHAAEAALRPEEIKTCEQLYLTALHLEQYRHATYSPVDYYEEALRRDPLDYRCNNALGLWYIRKGRFDKAEPYLRTAQQVLYKRNPNPYDGEPLYNLGLALKYQGKDDEAYEWFWKSTWNKAWADAGYVAAAQMSLKQHRPDDALEELERCLLTNQRNHKARALMATALRLTGRTDEALQACRDALTVDPFNYGALFEEYLLTNRDDVLQTMKQLMHGNIYNYHELALDYAQAGCWQAAVDVLNVATTVDASSPMTFYYLGWAYSEMSQNEVALAAFQQAEQTSSDYCFPNRLEDIVALRKAQTMNPDGAMAPYYLGCLYYDKRQYDVALNNWERSSELNAAFPTVWRNLALAYFNKYDRRDEAQACMERAFSLNTSDARLLMELDQLYRRLQRPHAERLALLEEYRNLVNQRDDLLIEYATLLNQTGQYLAAKELIDSHCFHPWEGGEGKVSTQYQVARVKLAIRAIAEQRYNEAVTLLTECLDYPHHLGEGKLYGAQENDFYYFLGLAHEALGNDEMARHCFEQATHGPQEPEAALYYNDAKPDKIFYQGMALLKLGRQDEANGRFYKLINYGKNHYFDKVQMDYFAVSLPDLLIWEDSLEVKNIVHCCYMLALGYFGLGEKDKARKYLSQVEALDINHLGVMQVKDWMQS